MRRKKDDHTLTRAEMEIMNMLWDAGKALSTHAIIEQYPDPKPAYSTVATFMKILTTKEFVSYRKGEEGDKTFYFYPLITRAEYTRKYMKEVKNTLFGGSLKSLLTFFVQEEELAEDDLRDILEMINQM